MFRRFFSYLLGKRSEVTDLDFKDVVLGKVVLDIHRKRSHKELVTVPLFALRPIHRLDRENALAATRRRIEMLREHRAELAEIRVMSCEVLARHLPSVSWIKVVERDPDCFLAFEGNGRLAALQVVFEPSDGIEVEVEQYHFRNPRKILRRLDRVRRLNHLLDEGASVFGTAVLEDVVSEDVVSDDDDPPLPDAPTHP